MSNRFIAALTMGTLVAATPAWAATVSRELIGSGAQQVTLIVIEGEIKPGDDRLFANEALATDKAVVGFHSPGGDVGAGIEIGRAIRLKRFSTLAAEGYPCASACALAWLAGQPRLMGSNTSVGFHAVFRDGGAVDSVGNAVVGAYLNQLGLSTEAIAYISEAPPSEIRWLTFEEASKVGIDVLKFPPTNQTPSIAADQPATVSEGKEWIQLFSRSDRKAATDLAQAIAPRYPNVAVFRYDNGWFVVVLGPYASGTAEAVKGTLVASRKIPADSFVTSEARFVGSVAVDESVLSQMDAIRATNEFFRIWSLPNDQSLSALADLYFPMVDYYGQRLSAAAVVRSKSAYADRWPDRNYRVREGNISCVCTAVGECVVEGILEWDARSPKRLAKSDGVARFRLKFLRQDGVKLMSEWSEVTERTLSKGR